MKRKISFDEFLEIEKSLEIKMGCITSVERIPKSTKMLKLSVTFGKEDVTVMTNIGDKITDIETLQHKYFPFITNLEPVKIMGVESFAMIMPLTFKNGDLYPITAPVIGGLKLL